MSRGRVRGLVHVHSEYSYDSATPLLEVKRVAVGHGMSFVVQTEHSNELTAEAHARFVAEARSLCDDDFLMLPAVEYSSLDNKIHVLALGVAGFWEDLRLCPPDRLRELLDRIRNEGGLSVLAHPERSDAIDRLPPSLLERFDAIEVWNGKTDKFGPSPRGLKEVAARRRAGTPTLALAGLDLHRTADYLPVGIELERRPRHEQELMASIREARFRIFFGPFRWDAARCGSLSSSIGAASKLLVAAARTVKRHLRVRTRRHPG